MASYTDSGGQRYATYDTKQATAVMHEKHGIACDMLRGFKWGSHGIVGGHSTEWCRDPGHCRQPGVGDLDSAEGRIHGEVRLSRSAAPDSTVACGLHSQP